MKANQPASGKAKSARRKSERRQTAVTIRVLSINVLCRYWGRRGGGGRRGATGRRRGVRRGRRAGVGMRVGDELFAGSPEATLARAIRGKCEVEGGFVEFRPERFSEIK